MGVPYAVVTLDVVPRTLLTVTVQVSPDPDPATVVHCTMLCATATKHVVAEYSVGVPTGPYVALMAVPSGPKLVPVSATTEPPASGSALPPVMAVMVDTE